MEVPKKLKVQLTYDPAIPLLGILLKKKKATYNRETCISMLIAALVTIAKL
jgi:hypothetical protein